MPIFRPPKRRRTQAGYSLLMVVFMVATVLIFAAMATPNLLTQGRRERETELVWRGEQYERAIGLYYRKFGKYPTKVDDLVKQTNGVRFLRQAYTDPMNKEDGSWRFIYVGPNGQLIGSVNQTNLVQGLMPQSTGVGGPGSFFGGSQTPSGSTATTFGAGGQPGGAAGAPGTTASPTPGAPAPNSQESQPQPLGGAVLGGNIIGVGSKVKQASVRVYQGEDNYQEWEFIWNPNLQGAGIPAATPLNPAAPGTTPPPGTVPPGTTPPPATTPPPPTQ
jgi:type II secretory pathway pseudopilin PulG